MREAFLHVHVQRVVGGVAIRRLRVDRSKRRDRSRSSQRTSERAVEHLRSYKTTRERLREEVVRGVGPEEVCDRGVNNPAAEVREGCSDHARYLSLIYI